MAPKRTTRSTPVTPAPNATTTTVTEAQLQALIDQGVAAAMAEAEASRVTVVGMAKIADGFSTKSTTYFSQSLLTQILKMPNLWTSKALRESSDSLDGSRKWNLCLALAIAQQLVKSNSRLALCKTMLLHGGIPMLRPPLQKLFTRNEYLAVCEKASKSKPSKKVNSFTTELMEDKTHAYAERQAERKRKYDDLPQNNPNQQQQNRRQNTGQAYAAGNGDRKPYEGSKPLCSKCNCHHEAGPCPPRCSNCNRVGHLARDCRIRPANNNNDNNNNNNRNNNNNNYRNNNNNNQQGNGCFECGAQGHFKRNCPKLNNNDRGSHDLWHMITTNEIEDKSVIRSDFEEVADSLKIFPDVFPEECRVLLQTTTMAFPNRYGTCARPRSTGTLSYWCLPEMKGVVRAPEGAFHKGFIRPSSSHPGKLQFMFVKKNRRINPDVLLGIYRRFIEVVKNRQTNDKLYSKEVVTLLSGGDKQEEAAFQLFEAEVVKCTNSVLYLK
ncbi:putative reverse transcriptase domain-containing protein [Tanacetum coccineum]